jgi:hypothetical protein
MFYQPADILNRAFDALGLGFALGSLEDGTTESEPARRAYGPCLRQLLRAAAWNFARKSASLQLLADATGQTLDPGTGQPISTQAEAPWRFAYAWPNDGVAARWLPWQMSSNGSVPLMTNLGAANGVVAPRPARFLVSSSDQFPVMTGQVGWDQLPDLGEGVGPIGRRIVLTDVQNALFVYTRLVLSIEEWDPLFQETFVALLAQRLALSVVKDRKEAILLRDRQIMIVKDNLMEARAHNANEAGFPQSLDHTPDWIRARRGGGARRGAEGVGVLGYGWEPLGLSDGSVF